MSWIPAAAVPAVFAAAWAADRWRASHPKRRRPDIFDPTRRNRS